MAELAVQTSGLQVALGGRTVLTGVNFAATTGEITVVLGPNGAGKSTLLKAIAGLVDYKGSIAIDGESLLNLSRVERVRKLAYVPQRSMLTSAFSVEAVVRQGRYSFGRSPDRNRARVEQAMERVDVTHLARRPFTQLSEGEHRRVLLARALATEAPLILLDEPTSSLDVAHALRLFDLLRTLTTDGYTVVIVVHNLDDAVRFTDHAVLLNQGEVAYTGKSSQVVSEGPVRNVYGVEMSRDGGLGFRLPKGKG